MDRACSPTSLWWAYSPPVLGTCATFSATAPLARTEKGGARRGGAKVKNNGAVPWRTFSAPYANQILQRNLNKLLIPTFEEK